jgi:hypothetical protein
MDTKMNSTNPITIIEELHDSFRKTIHKNCSSYVIKLRWIEKLTPEAGLERYMQLIKKTTYKNWASLLKKAKENCLIENHDVIDDWVLDSLMFFDLDQEIEQAFREEWDLLGPPPTDL